MADSDCSRDFNFNVRSDGPDSTQIVGRLMQIREYIKQASTMMDGFKKSDDSGNDSTAKQLQDVILRLRDQEEKYLDLLMKLSSATKEESLVRKQMEGDESDTEAGSVDLDVRSVQSDTTNDTNADLAKKNEDLEALKQQHELLKKMLYQQEQLRALQGRQAALKALQRDAELKLIEEKERKQGETHSRGVQASQQQPQQEQGDMSTVTSDSEDMQLPTYREVPLSQQSQQAQLKHQLDYMRNVYNLPDKSETTEDDVRPQSAVTESDISVLSVERRQLQNKLKDLQDKKTSDG